MKALVKFIALFMAILTVGTTLVACGEADAQVPQNTVADRNDVIINGDMQQLAEAEEEEDPVLTRTYCVDDVSIRSGDYAKENYSKSRKSSTQIEIKKGGTNTERQILLKFKMDELEMSGAQSVYLYLFYKANKASVRPKNGEKLSFRAYTVSPDWKGSSVTFATAPTFTEADLAGVGEALALNSDLQTAQLTTHSPVIIDVSDAVFEVYDNGGREIAFRITVDANTDSALSIWAGNAENEYARPKLVVQSTPADETYEKKLVADKAENEAIWAYAQQVYDDWYARYQEILKNDYKPTLPNPNPADYTIKVKAQGSDGNEASYTFDTRLVSTLTGYEEKIYDVDTYGGALTGERQEATGYYYTKKIGDRWWIVDPVGNLCHVHGTTHLKYAYTNTSTTEIDAALRVFGTFEKWAIAATRWVKDDLGFNMAYTHSAEIETVENNLPIMVNVNGIKTYSYTNGSALPRSGTKPVFLGDAMPVFDPGFVD